MERPLRELAEELIALGDAAFRDKHRVPVLLCRLSFGDDDRSFHTVMGSQPSMFETADDGPRLTPDTLQPPTLAKIPALDELPEQSGELVYFVRKRAGGAFRERIGVGRAPNADVSIPLPRLSKYHAYFVLPEEPGEEAMIADAGSKNGTWVDGRRVDPKESVPVTNGCTIRLGPYHMSYHTADGLRAVLRRSLTDG